MYPQLTDSPAPEIAPAYRGDEAEPSASDGALLRSLRDTGPGADAAFGELMKRHGPMVLTVCRRVLGDRAAADDAFQATFLLLLRKNGSVRRPDSLASWLYGVAYRVAHHARRSAARRRLVERSRPTHEISAPKDPARTEAVSTVRQEVERLPVKLREPLILCYLEDRTHEQAAAHLGWPVGTVRSRLARGRELLRGRLQIRGIVATGAVALWAQAEGARAAVPEPLLRATSQVLSRTGRGGAAVVAAERLAREYVRAQWLKKIGVMTAIIATVVLAVLAASFLKEVPGC